VCAAYPTTAQTLDSGPVTTNRCQPVWPSSSTVRERLLQPNHHEPCVPSAKLSRQREIGHVPHAVCSSDPRSPVYTLRQVCRSLRRHRRRWRLRSTHVRPTSVVTGELLVAPSLGGRAVAGEILWGWGSERPSLSDPHSVTGEVTYTQCYRCRCVVDGPKSAACARNRQIAERVGAQVDVERPGWWSSRRQSLQSLASRCCRGSMSP
jgi:hypothetical protein